MLRWRYNLLQHNILRLSLVCSVHLLAGCIRLLFSAMNECNVDDAFMAMMLLIRIHIHVNIFL